MENVIKHAASRTALWIWNRFKKAAEKVVEFILTIAIVVLIVLFILKNASFASLLNGWWFM